MKTSDIGVGMRVVYTRNGETKRGTIIGNSLRDGDEVAAIEWDDGSLEKKNVNDLKMEGLEEEYQKIAAKVVAAAELLEEANAMAVKNGTSLYTMWYNGEGQFQRLFNQLDEAGWSSSSMKC